MLARTKASLCPRAARNISGSETSPPTPGRVLLACSVPLHIIVAAYRPGFHIFTGRPPAIPMYKLSCQGCWQQRLFGGQTFMLPGVGQAAATTWMRMPPLLRLQRLHLRLRPPPASASASASAPALALASASASGRRRGLRSAERGLLTHLLGSQPQWRVPSHPRLFHQRPLPHLQDRVPPTHFSPLLFPPIIRHRPAASLRQCQQPSNNPLSNIGPLKPLSEPQTQSLTPLTSWTICQHHQSSLIFHHSVQPLHHLLPPLHLLLPNMIYRWALSHT